VNELYVILMLTVWNVWMERYYQKPQTWM